MLGVMLATDADVVIGSRYVPGGSLDARWEWSRRLLSWWANLYSRAILGLRIRDMTAGFKLWRRSALQEIGLEAIRSNGYSFQVEMAYLCERLGFRLVEIPIHFEDRRIGQSKLDVPVKLESAWRTWQIRWRYRHLTPPSYAAVISAATPATPIERGGPRNDTVLRPLCATPRRPLGAAASSCLALAWFAPVLFPELTHASLLPYDNLYTFRALAQPAAGADSAQRAALRPGAGKRSLEAAHPRDAGRRASFRCGIPKSSPVCRSWPRARPAPSTRSTCSSIVLPLEMAYGWFTALQVALAGMGLYLFGARAAAAACCRRSSAASVYMFSGFLIVSVVFTMFLAAVPWLPLLLAVIEYIVRKQEEKGVHSFNPIPYVAVGAAIIGLVVLAGHPELIYYTLLVAGAYSLVRLVRGVASAGRARRSRAWGGILARRLLGWPAGCWSMVVLGVALGAVQLLPLVELLPLNFRAGSASLAQVRGWAWPCATC